MKKAILFFSTIAIAAILFSACKKSDSGPSATQRIQANWVFDKDYYHEVYPGTPDYRDTTIAVAGDYVDFRTDNKAYSRIDGYSDTVNYSILDDTNMIIDGDTATIQVLNDTQFQLYGRSGNYPSDYSEYTLYLKK